MGAMAEAMVRYAQPLLDETDGSHEQVEKAILIAQVCWNLALVRGTEREEMLASMQPALEMDDAQFADFRQWVIVPMVKRHHKMFPNMAGLGSEESAPRSRVEKYPGTGRNAPCPCNSGRKYKRCCGR